MPTNNNVGISPPALIYNLSGSKMSSDDLQSGRISWGSDSHSLPFLASVPCSCHFNPMAAPPTHSKAPCRRSSKNKDSDNMMMRMMLTSPPPPMSVVALTCAMRPSVIKASSQNRGGTTSWGTATAISRMPSLCVEPEIQQGCPTPFTMSSCYTSRLSFILSVNGRINWDIMAAEMRQ